MPPYIKNVLRFCGYDNCHSIAEITDDDFEYFHDQVRKGNIKKFFEELPDEGVTDIMRGSTCSIETVEHFEISRGHQKFIKTIAKLVKEYLEKSGVDIFSASPKSKKKSNLKNGFGGPTKKQKRSGPLPNSGDGDASGESSSRHHARSVEPSNESLLEDHKKLLVAKAVSILMNVTPELYKKVSIICYNLKYLL